MTVTLTRPYARITFTWSEDLQDCDTTSCGVEDDELDAPLAAKAHEGTDFPGWTTTIS